jgi:DNA-binding XRE family transcriptional regulator
MKIGTTIKDIRHKLSLTQIEFAKLLEVGQSTISSYELNVKIPSLQVAKKILMLAKSKRIKMTLDDIFQDE